MKKVKNSFVIFFLLLIGLWFSSIESATSCCKKINDNISEKFKIRKIKSNKKIYIIYAERNDTLFKIVTEKDGIKYSNCKKIQKNGEYCLSLKTLFPRYLMGVHFLPPGTTGRMGTIYNGIDVCLEIEHDIWDIYQATNLQGLYIIEELDKSHIELFDKPSDGL